MIRLPSATAVVFDVQRFCVHDGPGIRTTVFFKGCPLRCRWCQNPESLRPEVEPDRSTGAGGEPQAIGRVVSLGALVAEVERDRPFYDASGGGVTLSGGEPMHQPRFARAFVRACHERALAVGLQTAGACAWDDLAPLLDDLQFVHYDLKLVDADRHRRATGARNDRIFANARRLADAGAPVQFRLPVVPGINDSDADLGELAAFLRSIGATRITLLQYHRLGEAKLERAGFPLQPLGIDAARAAASLKAATQRLAAFGLEVHHVD